MTDEPVLENGVIRLRRCRPSDAEAVFEAVRESMAELSIWMPWCHPGYSFDDSRSWCKSRVDAWEKKTEFDFMIAEANEENLLGICGLNQINAEGRFANLGYWIRTGRTGQGIASIVVPLLAKFGFDRLKLHRIEIVVAADNIPSQRVAEKAGALREGLLRQRLFVNGKIFDAFMFSLVPADFE